jgi:hypothetical protein
LTAALGATVAGVVPVTFTGALTDPIGELQLYGALTVAVTTLPVAPADPLAATAEAATAAIDTAPRRQSGFARSREASLLFMVPPAGRARAIAERLES